jgi:hypothetical protein
MLDVTKQSRIQIQDLPELVELEEREQKAIVGGSYPPMGTGVALLVIAGGLLAMQAAERDAIPGI